MPVLRIRRIVDLCNPDIVDLMPLSSYDIILMYSPCVQGHASMQ